MKWYNAARDTLPGDSGKVILSVRGIYHQALYDKENNIFVYEDSGKIKVLEKTNDQVYWYRIPLPEKIHKETFKIVIADDDIDEQVFIKSAIATCKHRIFVDSVFNGVQLLDYLLKRNGYEAVESLPDLILLDLNMPVMDGFSFLQAFQKINLPRKDQVSIIIVTSSHDPKDMARAKQMGVTKYLTKPLTEESLFEALNEASGV